MCVRACVRACVRVCVCVCARVCTAAWVGLAAEEEAIESQAGAESRRTGVLSLGCDYGCSTHCSVSDLIWQLHTRQVSPNQLKLEEREQ